MGMYEGAPHLGNLTAEPYYGDSVTTYSNKDSVDNNVIRPSHYTDKQIEVIDYIRDTLTKEEYIGYCIGNVIKYVSRWRKKGGIEDLEKARVYLNWAIERETE